ncbi:Uncharacterized protein QTN25_005559 [Entamoeba marina]
MKTNLSIIDVVINNLILLILFLVFVYLIAKVLKKQFYLSVQDKTIKQSLGKPLFDTEVDMIVSTKMVKGLLEYFENEEILIFTPNKRSDVFSNNEVMIIPFKSNISLYCTFSPIEWDPRNYLSIEIPENLTQFHSNKVYIRFKYAHEVEIWYRYCHDIPLKFPHTLLKRSIEDLLVKFFGIVFDGWNGGLSKSNKTRFFPTLPFFKIERIKFVSHPFTKSNTIISFDGAICTEIEISHSTLKFTTNPFLTFEIVFLGLPFKIHVPLFKGSIKIRMNQKTSKKGWIEVCAPLLVGVVITFDEYIILPITSVIVSWALTIFLATVVNNNKEFEYDNHKNQVKPNLFQYQNATYMAFQNYTTIRSY